ncbi:MAG TPA: hypothetical protein VL595_14180 [Pseudonocardia sp.]|jgi:hypothetical protein|nr:hypothetical protein [Pseudonocardia sp.]
MELKPGLRLRSQVCTTELIVVRPAEVELTCGGVPVIGHGEEPGAGLSLDPALSDGTQLGKRYTDDSGALEVLVTKRGDGTLADGDRPLPLKEAKPLPSSD